RTSTDLYWFCSRDPVTHVPHRPSLNPMLTPAQFEALPCLLDPYWRENSRTIPSQNGRVSVSDLVLTSRLAFLFGRQGHLPLCTMRSQRN
ncbi:hypothetical protein B0H12DRAFT_1093904, partial [Mycena haematopus]